jgi:hypothetical protein
MHKNAMKCNETLSKWCKNKHGASKIIDTFETYQQTLLGTQQSVCRVSTHGSCHTPDYTMEKKLFRVFSPMWYGRLFVVCIFSPPGRIKHLGGLTHGRLRWSLPCVPLFIAEGLFIPWIDMCPMLTGRATFWTCVFSLHLALVIFTL